MRFICIVIVATTAVGCTAREAPSRPVIALLGSSSAAATGRDDLVRTVDAMDARLKKNPVDVEAAVRLADALLRQTRVLANGGLAARAEAALNRVLAAEPGRLDVQRLLGAVYLSQHRFADARDVAKRALTTSRSDGWMLGVLGDASLELGDYDDAFAAFDRMLAIRPNAAAYARASYAHELSGDLAGATRLMTMALEATSAHDAESVAWHRAQLGHLYLEQHRLADARREYEHANFVFPGHPFAIEGLARVQAAEGAPQAALTTIAPLLSSSPTPALLALSGDLLAKLGNGTEAERRYLLAEAAWESDAPEPAQLAIFLADRGRRLDDAVRIAEQAHASRHDIVTDDALAWAYFKSGRVADAKQAIARALRTGTRNSQIRRHADAIAGAQ